MSREDSGTRYLLRLRNEQRYFLTDRNRLSRLAYEAVRSFGADVGNLRISKYAVELDLLLNSEASLEEAAKSIEKTLGARLTLRKLDVAGPSLEKEEAVRLGVDLFNGERYWESHEAFESAWRNSAGAEKEFLQGIILAAAALVHLQKNEGPVSLSVMKRAYEKFAGHQGRYFGIDAGDLKEKVNRILSTRKVGFFKIDTP